VAELRLENTLLGPFGWCVLIVRASGVPLGRCLHLEELLESIKSAGGRGLSLRLRLRVRLGCGRRSVGQLASWPARHGRAEGPKRAEAA